MLKKVIPHLRVVAFRMIVGKSYIFIHVQRLHILKKKKKVSILVMFYWVFYKILMIYVSTPSRLTNSSDSGAAGNP